MKRADQRFGCFDTKIIGLAERNLAPHTQSVRDLIHRRLHHARFSDCQKKRPSATTCVPAFSKSGRVPCKFTEADVLPPPLTRIFCPKKLFVISRKGTATSIVGNFESAIASS